MLDLHVIIDGGHGYNTSGKRTPDGSMREWEFNNSVAQLVDRILREQYVNIDTNFVHDRTGAIDVPLKTRTDSANDLYRRIKGNVRKVVYVSIHANATGGTWNDAVGGTETFIHTSNPAGSRALATQVQRELVALGGLRDRGVKMADFHVLRETAMDAILVECAFMSNRTEAELLKTDGFRIKCAQAIVNGLAKQYGLTRKPAPVEPTPTPTTPPAQEGVMYRVVAGTYADRANAEALQKQLAEKGFNSFLITFKQ